MSHQLSSHQLSASINLRVTPFYRTVFIGTQPCQNLIYFPNPHTANRKKLFSWYIMFPSTIKIKKNFILNFLNTILWITIIGCRETVPPSDWPGEWQLTSRIWSHVSWGDWWGEISISPLPARYYILQQSFKAKKTDETFHMFQIFD